MGAEGVAPPESKDIWFTVKPATIYGIYSQVVQPNSTPGELPRGLSPVEILQVSIGYPTLIDTLDSNQQSPNVTAVIPICLITNQNVPTYTNFNLEQLS